LITSFFFAPLTVTIVLRSGIRRPPRIAGIAESPESPHWQALCLNLSRRERRGLAKTIGQAAKRAWL